MTRIGLSLCAASMMCATGVVRAEGWDCKNDVEIQCDEKSCEVSAGDAFTPMGLSFDSRGKVSLCAYSGCWEGTGKVLATSPFFVIAVRMAEWSNPIEGLKIVRTY